MYFMWETDKVHIWVKKINNPRYGLLEWISVPWALLQRVILRCRRQNRRFTANRNFTYLNGIF